MRKPWNLPHIHHLMTFSTVQIGSPITTTAMTTNSQTSQLYQFGTCMPFHFGSQNTNSSVHQLSNKCVIYFSVSCVFVDYSTICDCDLKTNKKRDCCPLLPSYLQVHTCMREKLWLGLFGLSDEEGASWQHWEGCLWAYYTHTAVSRPPVLYLLHADTHRETQHSWQHLFVYRRFWRGAHT